MRQVRWRQSEVSGPLLILRILWVFLLALPLSAFGQDVPYLVRDLPGLTIHDSMPYGQTSFWANTGNITWFTAMTASGGREIFKTDGTSAGTVQVTHGVGVPESKYNGPFLGVVNGKLIYGGLDGSGDIYGQGIYALDTNGGDPVLLHRIQLAYLTNGVVRDGKLFFSARSDTTTKHELWVTEGTPAATVTIELLPGEQGPFNGSPDTRLYSAGPWMYFLGTTPQGTGLHRTDGTADTTVIVLPFPKNIIASWTRVAPLGDRLLVAFANTAVQAQLWTTDGTTAGTIQIATTTSFRPIGAVGGQLLFESDGVWTTDGTTAGTHPSEIVKTSSSLGGLGNSGGGQLVGNRLFFIRNGWVYVTDGTAAGTHSTFLTRPGNISSPVQGFSIGNFYYFRNDDGVHGVELWRTDGTTTAMVADINPGPRNGLDNDAGFVRPDGTALFAATNYTSGREPWITDGTAAGTHILQNIAADDPLNGSSPAQLRATGSELFFTAHLTAGPAIGMSDGTSAGTSAALVDYRWSIGAVGAANGHYFFGNNVDGFYASDGTSAGTTKIYASFIGYGSFEPLPNGLAFIDHGDLWFSDGTIAGTRRLRSFDPTAYPNMFPGTSVAWISIGTELWKTDGSDAGTVRIPLNPAPTNPIYDVIEAGSRVYFLEESTSTHTTRLWRTDRDGANTTMVRELSIYRFVLATAHMVYFTDGGKVYRTDGTANGTIELPAELPAGYNRLCVGGISAAVGDTLFFISSTGSYYAPVLKLWRSDGTVAGTAPLQVMSSPQTTDDSCHSLVARGDNVYYTGYDADHGWELWQSDGTMAGTHLTADIYPGPESSLPLELTLAGSRPFFSANSPNIGRELWALGPQITRHRAVRR
jgi:ELWxxDGT repeat protein